MPGGFPRKVLCAIFYLLTVFYKLLISPNGGLGGSTVKHAAISAAVRGADVAVAVAVDVAVVAAVADTNRTVVAAACVCVVVVVVVVVVVLVAVIVGKMAGDPALTHARYFACIRCVSMH